MFYGLQLAMVNARFTTFKDTKHAEMVRKAPKPRTKPQRTQRSTKKEEDRAELPTLEGRALPQRTQRNTEEKANEDFTAEGAEVAKKEEQRGLATVTPTSEGRALPQRNTEEDQNPVDPQDSSAEVRAGAVRDFIAENAEAAEEVSPENGAESRIEDRLEPRDTEGIPGVESAKSIFLGVEVGEGVADNRPVLPPSEPPRKSSQSEVLMIPKDVEHHAGR